MNIQTPVTPSITRAFSNPVRIFSGRGARKVLISELAEKAILLVTTRRGRKVIEKDSILSELVSKTRITWVDTVQTNPDIEYLQAVISDLAECDIDAVIAVGGGSTIDTAKVLAMALVDKSGTTSLRSMIETPLSYEKIRPLRLYAIPTTAGTGSEVTPFSTVWDHALKKKYSLSGLSMYPYSAIVDSSLMDSLPIEDTINTGLDAINQAAESLWNRNANSITNAFATRALQLGFRALSKVAAGEASNEDRDNMADCSVLAGLAISHTRTALCHSISYPMTLHFGVPHGLACAFTMPSVLRYNIAWDDGRFIRLAKDLGLRDISDLVREFTRLNKLLDVDGKVKRNIPNFAELDALVPEMISSGRSENNLGDVDYDVVRRVISESWM